ncbi:MULTISPECIES: Nif11-like leader peptide family natural product precursor [unclassified Anabaena]|jgi:predicted ribosomally synthesized peptide with nif11-like leader|uniref:Nif11-like leader peptide family natural product precursor n=1 Tax=unclassified Anabaena TaxID=2619674 RepID=UPI001444D4D6|nr:MULTISPECIES: Nif11-like leader peptide family natural product precursor [unclassified Anabaena]MTJ08838.1 Nif11-like leader peptide family natural product precursor [Anabaena sp. UHCC 0204]MTJ53138.1 Nif11-like leader peptide family natural product precursor [Anabaena sp. UHCC 0253]
MAKENVVRLFRKVQIDADLKQKLNSAPNLEKFVQMAQEHGYDFTLEEWQDVTRFQVEELQGNLSEIPGI